MCVLVDLSLIGQCSWKKRPCALALDSQDSRRACLNEISSVNPLPFTLPCLDIRQNRLLLLTRLHLDHIPMVYITPKPIHTRLQIMGNLKQTIAEEEERLAA